MSSSILSGLLDCFIFIFVAIFKRVQFYFFPKFKEEELRSSKVMSDEKANFFKWNKDNLGEFLYTWKMLYVIFQSRWSDAFKTAKLGGEAPNPQVVDVKTGQLVDLIQKGIRPQVINFGSCTWPPFMASLVEVDKVSLLAFSLNL